MKQRRSTRSLVARWSLAAATLAPLCSVAQAGPAGEAALFLLLPIGARASSLGQAMASVDSTVDAAWWNPAGLASLKGAQIALHHSQSLIGNSEALALTFGAFKYGVLALTANLLEFGGGIVTGPDSVPAGEIFPRNVGLGASYAARVGPHIRIGATYRVIQFRFDCSGECPSLPSKLASTASVDIGAQAALPTRIPVIIGVSLRNAGTRLQINDSRNATDKLPTRLQLGASGRYRLPKRLADDAVLLVALDLLDEFPLHRPLPRAGAEFVWEKTVFVRGGYVTESSSSEAGGASVGIGIAARRFMIDFGRSFSGLSADAGQAPTYVSLRYTF